MNNKKVRSIIIYKVYFEDFFIKQRKKVKGKLIVLMNGFEKKTQKTPKKEIEKVLNIKNEYEQENK